MKKTFIFLVSLLIFSSGIFIACSKDVEIPTAVNEQNLNQNLKKYSEDFWKTTILIDNEFAKNKKINKDSSFKNTLLLAKNENEVSQILKNAGVLNSETILTLIKKRIEIQNNFRVENPNFYLLEISKRSNLITKQYDLVLEEYIAKQNISAKTSSCAGTYNTGVSRCNRTFGKCAAVAVIAAAEGFFPGVVVGVFCAWDLSDCKSDALEDYESCQN